MNLPPIPAPATIANQSNNSNLGHQAEGSMRIMVLMVPSMPWKTHVDSGAMWKLTHAIPPCHDLDDFWWLMHGFISPPCLWEYLLAIYFNCNPIFSNVLQSKNRTSSNDAKITLNNQPRKSIGIILGIDKSSSVAFPSVSLIKWTNYTSPPVVGQRASILRWLLCESRNFTTSVTKRGDVKDVGITWTLNKDDCQVSIQLDKFSSRKVMAR